MTEISKLIGAEWRELDEEGKKVARNKGSKYLTVFRRRTVAEAHAAAAKEPFFYPIDAMPHAPVLSASEKKKNYSEWHAKKMEAGTRGGKTKPKKQQKSSTQASSATASGDVQPPAPKKQRIDSS